MIARLCLVLVLILTPLVAQAESLIVTLSDRTVDITSNFTGSSITVFGAVRRDASTVPRASDYDVVVTVVGPEADRVARLKERTLGVWVNRAARTFEDVPSAYTALSNRSVEDIAHPALLRRFQIG
ncbi:MAG: TIGR02186 family protein, partial [Devosiaceae bacterium]